MDSILRVSFLPDSVTERWAIGYSDVDEMNQLLVEIIDLYRLQNFSAKSIAITTTSATSYSVFVGQLLNKVSKTDDSTVKVNCLRLLSLFANDHISVFLSKSQLNATFAQIEVFLQDSSRAVRKQALLFAVTIASRSEFNTLAPQVTALLESSKHHQDQALKLATFTLLQCHLIQFNSGSNSNNSSNDSGNVASSVRGIAAVAVHRIQRCQPREGNGTGGISNGNVSDSSSDSSEGYSGKSEAKKIFEASVDALAAACMVYSHSKKSDSFIAPSATATSNNTPHAMLNELLNDLESYRSFRQRSYHSEGSEHVDSRREASTSRESSAETKLSSGGAATASSRSIHSSGGNSVGVGSNSSLLTAATHREVCNRLYVLEFKSMDEELIRPLMEELLRGISTHGMQSRTASSFTKASVKATSTTATTSMTTTTTASDVFAHVSQGVAVKQPLSLLKKPPITRSIDSGDDLFSLNSSPSASFLSLEEGSKMSEQMRAARQIVSASAGSDSLLVGERSPSGGPRKRRSSRGGVNPVSSMKHGGADNRDTQYVSSGSNSINDSNDNSPCGTAVLGLKASSVDNSCHSQNSNSAESSPASKGRRSQSFIEPGSAASAMDPSIEFQAHSPAIQRRFSGANKSSARVSKYRSQFSGAAGSPEADPVVVVDSPHLIGSTSSKDSSANGHVGSASSKSPMLLQMPSLDAHNSAADSDNESATYIMIDSDAESDAGPPHGLARQLSNSRLQKTPSRRRLLSDGFTRQSSASNLATHTDVSDDDNDSVQGSSHTARTHVNDGNAHHHVTESHHSALSGINKRRSISAVSPPTSADSEKGSYSPSRAHNDRSYSPEPISGAGQARQINRTPQKPAERPLQSHSAPRRIERRRSRGNADSPSPEPGVDRNSLPSPGREFAATPSAPLVNRDANSSTHSNDYNNHYNSNGRRSAGSAESGERGSAAGRCNRSIAYEEDDEEILSGVVKEHLPKLNFHHDGGHLLPHNVVSAAVAANDAAEHVEHGRLSSIAAPKSKNESYDYLAPEDIHPCKSPQHDFNKAIEGLEVQDWPEIFHTLNTLRAVALHHPNIIVNSGALHSMITQVVKRVENLRSSLAKNAIILLSDLFQGLGKHMDAEVATVVPCLLKRSSESSLFLVESADATLQLLMEKVTVFRSIAALATHLNHRSPALRARLAICFHSLVVARAAEIAASKEFDNLKHALCKLVNERAPDARAHSRDAIRFLVANKIATKSSMESHLSPDQLEKILKDPYTPSLTGEKMSMLSSFSRSKAGDASSSSSFSLQRSTPNSKANTPVGSRVQSGRRSNAGGNSSSSNSHGVEGFDPSPAAFSPMGGKSPRVDISSNSSSSSSAAIPLNSPKRASAGRHRRSPGSLPASTTSPDDQSINDLDSYGGAYINSATPVISPRADESYNSSATSSNIKGQEGYFQKVHATAPVSGTERSKQETLAMRHSLPAVPNSPKPSAGGLISGSFSSGSARDSPLRRSFHSNKNTGSGNTSAASSSSGAAGQSAAAVLAVAAAAKRAMETDPELMQLQEMLVATTVKSWTERKEAMTALTTLMVNHYDVLRDANKLHICIDNLLDRLEDGSAKVHIHTLACLERINDEEPFILQHNLMTITAPALLSSAGSSNKPISAKSLTLLRTLFDTVSPQQVGQFLCHSAVHDADKLRLSALRLLADVMPVFCVDNDSVTFIVKKTIFPTISKLLFQPNTKGDVRVHCVEAIKAMQKFLRGEKIWLWSDDPHQQEELKRITANL